MTDIIQSTPGYNGTYVSSKDHNHMDLAKVTEAIGNLGMHQLNAEQVTQKSVSDAAHHLLNSEQITQKAIGDTARDILLDNGLIKQSIRDLTDTIHVDGNSTRSEVKAEGRNLDNKICDLSHHVEKGLTRVNELILENKFEFTKQNSELSRYLSEKLSRLDVEVLKQGSETRFHAAEIERRSISDELQELRIKTACCHGRAA